jgi:hypothetical protein
MPRHRHRTLVSRVRIGFATGAAIMSMSKDQQLSELRERLAQANREREKVLSYIDRITDLKHLEQARVELAGIYWRTARIQREIEKLEQ